MQDPDIEFYIGHYDFSLIDVRNKYVKEISSDEFHRVFHETSGFEFCNELKELIKKNYIGERDFQTFWNTLRLCDIATIDRTITDICNVFEEPFRRENSPSANALWSKIQNKKDWMVDELCGWGIPNYSILRFTLVEKSSKMLTYEKERCSFLFDHSDIRSRVKEKVSHGIFLEVDKKIKGWGNADTRLDAIEEKLVKVGVKGYVEDFFLYLQRKHFD